MKNTKTFVLIGVLVLIIAGAIYLNFALAGKEAEEKTALAQEALQPEEELELPVVAVTGDTFTTYKENREETRAQEIAYLDSIIQDERTDAETLADAQEQKLATVASMEKELVIEGLLGAKGFGSVIVTVHTGSVNVALQSDEITDAQAAQILDIVKTETSEPAKNIKIILQG